MNAIGNMREDYYARETPLWLKRPGYEASPIAVSAMHHARIAVRVIQKLGIDVRMRSSLITGVSSCDIKGNVSYNGGEKIYHMPGQRDYASTIILISRGERWFCSEDEARGAGWRKTIA